jgi:hypothetical protein
MSEIAKVLLLRQHHEHPHAYWPQDDFAAVETGPADRAAGVPLAAGFGAEVMLGGHGGSIPIVSALAPVAEADLLLVGTTDRCANIHAPNDRVRLDEFERAVIPERKAFRRAGRAVSAP